MHASVKTGIFRLSLGSTVNRNQCVLTRYSVTYFVDTKIIFKCFYFGQKVSQKSAFKNAMEYMIEKKLYLLSIKTANKVYIDFKHADYSPNR